mgnify:CR=1 FL=1
MTKAALNWQEIFNAFYIERRTNAAMIADYELPIQQSLHKCFPAYVHKDLTCEYCSRPLESQFVNKNEKATKPELIFNIRSKELSEVKQQTQLVSHYHTPWLRSRSDVIKTDEGYLINIPTCHECNHKPIRGCSCNNCENEMKAKKEVVAEMLAANLQISSTPTVELEQLNTKDIYLMLYALTYCLNKDSEHLDLSVFTKEERATLIERNLLIPVATSIKSTIDMLSPFEYAHNENNILYQYNGLSDDSPNVVVQSLKKLAISKFLEPSSQFETIELWGELALLEALGCLQHYCEVYKLAYNPGQKTMSSIKRSLTRYGLAQTARYIYNAVKLSHSYGLEQGYDRKRTFNLIYGKLNFLIDDERVRTWNLKPFNRSESVLSEPLETIIFSHSFLEPHGIDFLTSPIIVKQLENIPSLEQSD